MIAGVPIRVAPRMTDYHCCGVASAGPLRRLGSSASALSRAAARHRVQCGVGGGSTGRDLGNGVQHNMTEMVQHPVPALTTGGTRRLRVVRAVAAHRGATGPRSLRIAPSVPVGPGWVLGIGPTALPLGGSLLAKLAHGGSISALTRRIGVRIFRTSAVLTSETGGRSTRWHVYRPMLRHEFCTCHRRPGAVHSGMRIWVRSNRTALSLDASRGRPGGRRPAWQASAAPIARRCRPGRTASRTRSPPRCAPRGAD